MNFSQSPKFPQIFDCAKHSIDENLIDSDALFVLQKLREAGYLAFLVGGSVRDLLLQIIPKDFDISTSARPEEIKRLFGRSCILIGRRFRLAHLRFGHKVIEVSTFRSGENETDLIVHDNKWGNEVEDVMRRDFTINGLFYDAQKKSVIDYVGGWNDIQARVLRTIGDPAKRFRQDPVRMIRLLKFQARLGFEIDIESKKALESTKDEIVKSAPPRILEEILRMLESGAAAPFFDLMRQSGLLELLFPSLAHFMNGPHGLEILNLLKHADSYNKLDLKRPLDRSVLTACLVFPILQKELETQYLSKEITPHMGEVLEMTHILIDAVMTSSFSHFPRRISSMVGFILSTQYRLTPFSGKRHHRPKLMLNKEFPYAMQFFRLRAQIDSCLEEAYRSWRNAYHQLEHPKEDHKRRTHTSKQHHGLKNAEE